MAHLNDFAHHLISTRGPLTPGMVHAVFTQLGNSVPGATIEDQHAHVENTLKADQRLELVNGSYQLAPRVQTGS